jgi:hypothetical protein
MSPLPSFAKRMWLLTQREKDLEKAAAEQRRRATLLAEAEAKAGRQSPQWLSEILRDAAPQHDRRSFPGAWPIPQNARPKDVDAMLMRKTNLDLLHTWRATADAAALSENNPALRDEFLRGVKIIEHGAQQRGFDLKTGKHHPERATDQKRARIHCDELPDAIQARPDRSPQPRAR